MYFMPEVWIWTFQVETCCHIQNVITSDSCVDTVSLLLFTFSCLTHGRPSTLTIFNAGNQSLYLFVFFLVFMTTLFRLYHVCIIKYCVRVCMCVCVCVCVFVSGSRNSAENKGNLKLWHGVLNDYEMCRAKYCQNRPMGFLSPEMVGWNFS